MVDLDQVRLINQYMLSHCCVTEKQFEDQLKIFKDYDGSHELEKEEIFQSVQAANSKLKQFNIMIRSVTDDNENQNYYVLISTVDNDITRAASHHTPKQFEFFKQVIHELASERKITIKDFKRIGSRSLLNAGEIASLRSDWVEKKWLFQLGDLITLGVRSKGELDVYIKSLNSDGRSQ